MKVVLDTNVLVSGLLQPRGPSGRILRALLQRAFYLCFDARILDEYRRVLSRPKFPFRPSEIAALLDFIRSEGAPVAAVLSAPPLPDPDDAPFLEVALGGGATFLVTGNLRHFPVEAPGPPDVVSPRAFLDKLDQLYPNHPPEGTSRSASAP